METTAALLIGLALTLATTSWWLWHRVQGNRRPTTPPPLPAVSPVTGASPPLPNIAGLCQLAPDSWFSDRSKSSVWATLYRMVMLPPEFPPNTIRGVDFHGVRLLVHRGKLRYFDMRGIKMEFTEHNTIQFHGVMKEEAESIESGWAILLTPHSIDGQASNEELSRARIEGAVGALAAVCGANAVYERYGDYSYTFADGKMGIPGPIFRSPLPFGPPRVDPINLQALQTLGLRLGAASPELRERALLSLRWHHQALESDGLDAFLKAWVALEIIGMPDGSHIAPLTDSLGRAYGLPSKDAHTEFLVGHLFGLRSRIVHEGRPASLDYHLITFIRHVYIDVLFEHLSIPCRHYARGMLTNTSVPISDLLKAALA